MLRHHMELKGLFPKKMLRKASICLIFQYLYMQQFMFAFIYLILLQIFNSLFSLVFYLQGAFTYQNFDQDLNFHATEDDPVTKKVSNSQPACFYVFCGLHDILSLAVNRFPFVSCIMLI